MKTRTMIFSILLLASAAGAQAPNCDELVVFPASGNGGINRIPIVLPGIKIQTLNIKMSYLLISISLTDGSKCLLKGKPIEFIFEDGSRIALPNDNDLKCSSEGHINLGGQHKHKEELQQLKNKQIKSIKMATNAGLVETSLTREQQQLIHEVINCIAEKI